jgi:hypothetical protein
MRILEGVGTIIQLGGLLARLSKMVCQIYLTLFESIGVSLAYAGSEHEARVAQGMSQVVVIVLHSVFLHIMCCRLSNIGQRALVKCLGVVSSTPRCITDNHVAHPTTFGDANV